MMDPSARAFYIEDWLVEPDVNRLTREGESLVLEPKIMDVLVCLAARPGKLVHRSQLLDVVWNETVVTDHVLNRSIYELRKIFDDDPKQPHFIETIPKAGYRLIAPVRFEERPPPVWRGDGAGVDGASEPAASYVVEPTPPSWSVSVPSSPPMTRRVRWWWAGSSLLVLILIGGLMGVFLRPATHPEASFQIVPLTSSTGEEREPTFSPDGNYVAYVVNDGTAGSFDLYVQMVGTGKPLRLTKTPGSERRPAWSPDGRHIAFFRRTMDTCSINLIPVLGGSERRLSDCSTISSASLAWSPDGQRLISAERDAVDLPYRLYTLSLETLERRPLTTPPRAYTGDTDPAFSPDGETLAFVRATSPWSKDIYVMPAHGGTAVRRTTYNRDFNGLTWGSQGNHLIFSANLSGEFGLWTLPRKGGQAEPLPTAGGQYMYPVYAPQTQRLAFEHHTIDTNIWRHALAGAAESPDAPFISSTRSDLYPIFSPDGEQIAYVSSRSGSYEVWVSNADGTQQTQVTSLNGAFIGMPFWAPKRRHLVFEAFVGEQADVYVLDLEQQQPRRLTTHPFHDLATGWSHDGRWVYFASERTGRWQIWKVPVDGGSPQQVTEEGGYIAAESQDGAVLYYSKPGQAGVWGLPVAGGEEHLVLEALPASQWGNWALVNQSIYFVSETTEAGLILSRFDLGTHEINQVTRVKPSIRFSGLSVSPDEQWLLYTHTESSEADIILAENVR